MSRLLSRSHCWSLLGLVLLPLGVEKASAADVGTRFIVEYKRSEPVLYERYVQNRKVRVRTASYYSDPNDSKRGTVRDTSEFEVISDGMQHRIQPLAFPKPEGRDRWYFWTPELCYTVNKDGSRFGVTDFVLAEQKRGQHEQRRGWAYNYIPLLAGGQGSVTSYIFSPEFMAHNRTKITSVKDVTRDGRQLVAVTLAQNRPEIQGQATYYYDASNVYICCGMEGGPSSGPRVPDSLKRKHITKIEYQPSAEGFPIPKSFRRSIVLPDGTAIPEFEVTFLSYERYTPSPEEFRLEERFGLATPYPGGPVPAPPRRRSWPWWLLAVGVAVALAVGTRQYLRRRRAASAVA